MASWQYEFLFMPMKKAKDLGLLPDTIFSAIDHTNVWINYQPPKDFSLQLSSIMPKAQSWSDQVEIWGSESGNRVQLITENGSVEEISVRIDLRSDFGDFLKTIIEIAHAFDFLIIGENYRLITPDKSEILKDIQRSPSFKFVKNPDTFFESY